MAGTSEGSIDASEPLSDESDSEEAAGTDATDAEGTGPDLDADAIETDHFAELRDRLLDAADWGDVDDPLARINGRVTLLSHYSAVDLGLHDGLGGIPRTSKAPPAVLMLRDEENERKASIRLAQVERRTWLENLIIQRDIEVERATQDLSEAMFRLAREHPNGLESGYFASDADARSATAQLPAKEAESEEEKKDSELAVDAKRTEPRPSPRAKEAAKATPEQEIAASRELGWSIDQGWFWAGSAVLFLAEFPFLMAVVRQLLLEPDPPDWKVVLSTVSVIAGFLVATKLTGLLLRRAQSILLLAARINPSRRPLLARIFRRDEPEARASEVRDPTEGGLRYGAWYRLMLAALLILLLLGAVISIAFYRSEAADSLAEQAKVQQVGAGQLGGDTAEESLDAPLVPDVGQDTLQQVFLFIGLLNVVGAVALAWASTDGTYDLEVAGDSEADIDVSPPTAATDDDGDKSGRRRRWERNRRKSERKKESTDALTDRVEACRATLDQAKVRAEAARNLLKRNDQRAEGLVAVSAAQCLLDESVYWWANRSGRRVVTDVGVDELLASQTTGTGRPIIDLTEET